jgi:hypothetical protein
MEAARGERKVSATCIARTVSIGLKCPSFAWEGPGQTTLSIDLIRDVPRPGWRQPNRAATCSPVGSNATAVACDGGLKPPGLCANRSDASRSLEKPSVRPPVGVRTKDPDHELGAVRACGRRSGDDGASIRVRHQHVGAGEHGHRGDGGAAVARVIATCVVEKGQPLATPARRARRAGLRCRCPTPAPDPSSRAARLEEPSPCSSGPGLASSGEEAQGR